MVELLQEQSDNAKEDMMHKEKLLKDLVARIMPKGPDVVWDRVKQTKHVDELQALIQDTLKQSAELRSRELAQKEQELWAPLAEAEAVSRRAKELAGAVFGKRGADVQDTIQRLRSFFVSRPPSREGHSEEVESAQKEAK